MELEHDGLGGTTARSAEGAIAAQRWKPHPHAAPVTPIDPDRSTAALRRCTALATRARADLLTSGRHDASAQLADLLEEMAGWDPAALVDPDPTMTVLAAAALQDLADRLAAPAPAGLDARIDGVLDVLHAVMEQGRVAAPA